MWDFSLLAATRSIETSMPFVLYRLLVYLGVGLAYLLGTLAGAGTLIAFASFSANPIAVANFGGILSFIGIALLVHQLRGLLFFGVKAGNLALLAEQARGVKLAEGWAQVDYAKQAAAQAFPSPALFFEVSRSTGQALQALPSTHWRPLAGLKPPALARVADFLAGCLVRSGAHASLILHFLKNRENPWQSAQTALVFQARYFAELLKYRLYTLLFEYLGLLAAIVLMLYPINAAASALPAAVGAWRFVFALVFGWSLKAAFFEPIATAAMAGLYLKLAEREPPATEAEIGTLAEQSPAFRSIREKAV
jgi:hypothetical protein